MDDIRPNNLNPEELLSAYLDGEVTADERAQVEQMLASDPEARAALEELRALSAALQSLPKLNVGQDLSERVLRRAERAMLERQTTEPVAASAAAAQVSLASKTLSEQGSTLLEHGTHGAGWVRRLAWPLAAIAATLLIMLVNQKPKPELALAPADVHKQAPRADMSNEAVVRSAPAEKSREASSESAEELAAGNGFEGVAGDGTDRDGNAFSQPAKTSAEQNFEGANADADAQSVASTLQSEMKAARPSEQSGTPGPDRFGSTERQLQAKPEPAFAKAGQEGGGAAPAITPSADPAAAGASAPGASLANSPVADAKRARNEVNRSNPRVELVVEVLGSDGSTVDGAFDELLVTQNIRVEDFSAFEQRKQIADNRLVLRDERVKDRESQTLAENGASADAGTDKKAKALSEAKTGEDSNYRDEPPKAPELKEQEKSAAAAQTAAPLAIRGNRKGLGTAEPGKAPAAVGLSVDDADHLSKRFGDEPAAAAGENSGISREAASPSAEVEVVLVTATPAQVRGLLKEMESRSGHYRALPLDLAARRQLAADRSKDEQDKGDAQLESLAANRAAKAGPPNSPPAPAEEAKSQAHAQDETSSGYAVRWRVSEEQLASLMKAESLDQLAAGNHSYWTEGVGSGKLTDGIARAGEKREADMRQEQAGPNDLADATLRAETTEGAAKKANDEKSQTASQPAAAQTPAAAPVPKEGPAPQEGSGRLKAPVRSNAPGERGENQPLPDEADKSGTPAAPPTAADGEDALFDGESGLQGQRRAQLETQLRGAAENQQIRVLFVLRGVAPGILQNKADVAGQTTTPAGQPNAAAEPAPPAESAPAEAAPAKE